MNVLILYTSVYIFNTLVINLIFSVLALLVDILCIYIKHILLGTHLQ